MNSDDDLPKHLNPPLGVGWDRLQGWRNQYDRMLRWHRRAILAIEADARHGDRDEWPEEMWDTAWAFFQSAYHLKDWINRDRPETKSTIEQAFSRDQRLALCADICNGTKHGLVERNRRPRVPSAHLTAMREYAPDLPGGWRWLILGPDGPINLEVLVNDVLRAWQSLCNLIPDIDLQP